jgi:putative inorganic carbon (hco3(-)) transporter
MRTLFSPFTYVLIYVAMWYLRLHEYPDSPIQFPILTVLQAIAVSLWIVRTPRRLDVSHLWLLLLLLLSMFVSTITNGWAGGVVEVFNLFVPTILVFVMIAGTADSLKRLNLLAWTIAISLGVIALHGILESQTGVGWSGATLVEDTRITYVGLLGDPNDLAMALLMALPMQVYLLGTTRRLLPRLLLLACIGAVLWSTYLTNSRGAVLGLAAMLTCLSYRRYGLKRTLLIAPLLLVALVAGGPGRIDDMSADEDSAAGRVDAWYAGFEMFRERPLFGVGMGNFVEHNWLTAHNSFVLAMAELGTVGYFLWLALLATSIVTIRRIFLHLDRLHGDGVLPQPKLRSDPVHDVWPVRGPRHDRAQTLASRAAGALGAALAQVRAARDRQHCGPARDGEFAALSQPAERTARTAGCVRAEAPTTRPASAAQPSAARRHR